MENVKFEKLPKYLRHQKSTKESLEKLLQDDVMSRSIRADVRSALEEHVWTAIKPKERVRNKSQPQRALLLPQPERGEGLLRQNDTPTKRKKIKMLQTPKITKQDKKEKEDWSVRVKKNSLSFSDYNLANKR